MSNIEENTKKLTEFIEKKFIENEINEASLVQIIELAGTYLNLKTISKYCEDNKISYNGAKNYRNVINLFGVKFIIDNK